MKYEFIATYIMASKRNGTLYVGVTSNLLQRGLEHREGRFDGFAKKHMQAARVVGTARRHADCNRAREGAKAVQTCEEASAD